MEKCNFVANWSALLRLRLTLFDVQSLITLEYSKIYSSYTAFFVTERHKRRLTYSNLSVINHEPTPRAQRIRMQKSFGRVAGGIAAV